MHTTLMETAKVIGITLAVGATRVSFFRQMLEELGLVVTVNNYDSLYSIDIQRPFPSRLLRGKLMQTLMYEISPTKTPALQRWRRSPCCHLQAAFTNLFQTALVRSLKHHSVSIEIPPDVHSAVRDFPPDLAHRLQAFPAHVRHTTNRKMVFQVVRTSPLDQQDMEILHRYYSELTLAVTNNARLNFIRQNIRLFIERHFSLATSSHEVCGISCEHEK